MHDQPCAHLQAVGEGTTVLGKNGSIDLTTNIVYQLGNYTTDQTAAGYKRPEDLSVDPTVRPYYSINATSGGSDLAASAAGALAAAAIVWRDVGGSEGTYETYMRAARTAYVFATKYLNL